MNKNLFSMMLLFAAILITSCSKEEPKLQEENTIQVSFDELSANGSDSKSTTELVLKFDQEIVGLSASDIISEGFTVDSLSHKGQGVYIVAVSDVIDTKKVRVAISKSGYTFSPQLKEVAVFYKPEAPIAIGDYYYSDHTVSPTYDNTKTVIGVVCALDNDNPLKGKIMSVAELVDVVWLNKGVVIKVPNSEVSGLANMKILKDTSEYKDGDLPVLPWVDSLNTTAPNGIVWYMPALDELFLPNEDAVKGALAQIGTACELKNTFYWTSTDNGMGSIYTLNFFGEGRKINRGDTPLNARAMADFSL